VKRHAGAEARGGGQAMYRPVEFEVSADPEFKVSDVGSEAGPMELCRWMRQVPLSPAPALPVVPPTPRPSIFRRDSLSPRSCVAGSPCVSRPAPTARGARAQRGRGCAQRCGTLRTKRPGSSRSLPRAFTAGSPPTPRCSRACSRTCPRSKTGRLLSERSLSVNGSN